MIHEHGKKMLTVAKMKVDQHEKRDLLCKTSQSSQLYLHSRVKEEAADDTNASQEG